MHVLYTLNSLGTMSFGVSTPTKASTPQKRRIVKMMAKSLMSFLTYEGKKVFTAGLTSSFSLLQWKVLDVGY